VINAGSNSGCSRPLVDEMAAHGHGIEHRLACSISAVMRRSIGLN
jgi:hypothetical protein